MAWCWNRPYGPTDGTPGFRTFPIRHQCRKLAGAVSEPAVQAWFREYLSLNQMHISAVTVVERIRGYALLSRRVPEKHRERIEDARVAYLGELGRVWPLDSAAAIVSGEMMALLPHPPTAPRRAPKLVELRPERLVRWRFDGMIAATALVAGMKLIHNNAADFEPIRSAIEKSPQRFPNLGPLELVRCNSLA
jgi:predicted nucleic acid-binding protein